MIVCGEAKTSIRMLNRRHFDALIVDAEIPGASALLEILPKTKSNQRCTTFLVGRNSGEVLSAQFVMQKPLTPEYAARSFKAAYGLMSQEHTRYYRYEVDLPVVLNLGKSEIAATMDNISTGGMAVRIPQKAEVGSQTHFHFQLPGTRDITGEGKVVWSVSQKAGIQFTAINPQQPLEKWLSQQMM